MQLEQTAPLVELGRGPYPEMVQQRQHPGLAGPDPLSAQLDRYSSGLGREGAAADPVAGLHNGDRPAGLAQFGGRHQARQAGITQEISEIVGGVNALADANAGAE